MGAGRQHFGPDSSVVTPVKRTGTLKGSTLDGNLILVGKGDLTMDGRTKPDGTVDFADLDHTDANLLPGATAAPAGPAELGRLPQRASPITCQPEPHRRHHGARDAGSDCVDGDAPEGGAVEGDQRGQDGRRRHARADQGLLAVLRQGGPVGHDRRRRQAGRQHLRLRGSGPPRPDGVHRRAAGGSRSRSSSPTRCSTSSPACWRPTTTSARSP